MISVAIVGGKLQGIEACYLSKKAGYKSVLIDKNPNAPASGFCDESAVFDVRKKEEELIELLKKADFILPALEDDEVHEALLDISRKHGLLLAFDREAYSITSSKLKSDELMRAHRIPAPRYFPECGAPYIIKPSGESGSVGVVKAETEKEVRSFLDEAANPESWVIQEYLSGPSYSIEIIGVPGMYRTYEITQIHMADDYDCKMVTAPCRISGDVKAGFSETAKALAGALGLSGVMDVEVIDDGENLKVLEIDARLPSQTPIVVYHSMGANLLSELADITLYGKFMTKSHEIRRCAAIEHYLVDEEGAHWTGEHMMVEGGPLKYIEDFFGADEALTDYDGGRLPWRAAFINSAETEEELTEKRRNMLSGIYRHAERTSR